MKTTKGYWLALLLSFFSLTAYAETAKLSQIQIIKTPEYTRAIFTISDPNQYHIFTLSKPYRVVVDMKDTKLKTNINQLDVSNSHIKDLRSGWPNPETLRIVFDMDAKSRFKTAYTPGPRLHEMELVIDIYSPGAALNTSSSRANKPAVYVSQQPKLAEVKKAELSNIIVTKNNNPRIQASVLKPKLDTPIKASAIITPKIRTSVIVIDAGHGGKDPGTIGNRGTREKDVVLGIAKRLAGLINQEPNMRAVLTRRGDYFVKLRDRLRLARKDKADLFVSIHADAYQNEQSTGVSVYALSPHGATSEAARWLAKRENYSELGGVDFGVLGDKSYVLRSVLIDLAQAATITDSVKLGTNILDALDNVTKLHYSRVEQAPFVVLKSPDIPSVLVETGYLSNPREELNLRNPAYRDKIAQALLSGIQRYLAAHPTVGV